MNTKKQGEKKRKEILEAIIKYINIHGYAPNYREIGSIVGLKSTSSVKRHMEILFQDGKLKKDALAGSSRYSVVGYEFVKCDPGKKQKKDDGLKFKQSFCEKCGQAIDWREKR